MHQQTATCGIVSVAMKALKFGLWAVVSLTSVSSFSPSPALPYLGSIRSTLKLGCSRNTKNSDTTRSEFVSECIRRSLAALTPIGILPQANAFDGGVGGLGKKRPETGVVFRDPDAVSSASSSSSDDVTNELLSPDGTPAFVTFSSPWPQLQSAAGIETRDVSGGYESAFVQVAELPKGISTISSVKPAFLSQVIFSSRGKFGMYGVPSDIKIKKLTENGTKSAIFTASFTTLTPAMRESDRKAYISASIVGNGLFLLVTTTTSARFNKLDSTLRKVANSFSAIPAPTSNLRNKK